MILLLFKNISIWFWIAISLTLEIISKNNEKQSKIKVQHDTLQYLFWSVLDSNLNEHLIARFYSWFIDLTKDVALSLKNLTSSQC